MSKKKKKSSKEVSTTKILFATAIIQLITAVAVMLQQFIDWVN